MRVSAKTAMSRAQRLPWLLTAVVVVCLLFAATFMSEAQTPEPPARGLMKISVRYTKALSRKRFFLIKGSLADNRSLIEKIKQLSPISRECYYRSKGASDAMIKWLIENDCDSVYCGEIDEKYMNGSEAVPEFRAAYDQGLHDFKSPDLARKWLTVNLPTALRSGFYDQKQEAITPLIAEAEATTKTKVASVLTDRTGVAYLTDIEPGVYTISNLIGAEVGKKSVLWVCEKEVKIEPLSKAATRPLQLSNVKGPNCEIIERPLPACEGTAR
jgi:hypothetical protein